MPRADRHRPQTPAEERQKTNNEPCSFLVAAISRVAAAGQSRLEDEPPARPVLPEPPSAPDPPEPPEPPEPPAPPQPPASAHNTHPRWPTSTTLHSSVHGHRPALCFRRSTLNSLGCGISVDFFHTCRLFDIYCNRKPDFDFLSFIDRSGTFQRNEICT